MDPSGGEGGTKINRKPKLVQPSPQMNASPPQQQMAPSNHQMGPPPQQMPPNYPPSPPPQQMSQSYSSPPPQQMSQSYSPSPPPPSHNYKREQGSPVIIPSKKSNFGSVFDNSNFKNSLLVVFLFIILNSKIIWRQIQKLPMMGKVEPSMVALVFNSILAGVIFFLIKTFVIKN